VPGQLIADRATRALGEEHDRVLVREVLAMRSYTTRLGRIDVFRTLTGGKGYDELAPEARSYDVGGLVVRAASLDDVIASKEAAGRPKDIADLVRLRELQRELQAGNAEQDD